MSTPIQKAVRATKYRRPPRSLSMLVAFENLEQTMSSSKLQLAIRGAAKRMRNRKMMYG